LKRGYSRVSTTRQDLDIQIAALKKEGCGEYYCDKVTGIKVDKADFDRMMAEAEKGDTIVVYAISRMSRSLKQLIHILEEIKSKELHLKSLTEPVDTTTPTGMAFFLMLGVFAQMEREMIVQRVVAGSALARAEGKGGGRKPRLEEKQVKQLKELYATGNYKVDDLCNMFGVGKTALYKYLHK